MHHDRHYSKDTNNESMNILWDAHCCPSFQSESMSFLTQYKKANFDFVSINIGFGPIPHDQMLLHINRFRQYIDNNKQNYDIALSANDIFKAKRENKLAIAFDIEGVDFLGNDVELLDLYHSVGVRQIAIVYNKNNLAGGGCQDNDNGLTGYGKKVIKKMNQLGIVVDCSHAGHKTTMDIIKCTEKPVVFSHSNSFFIHNHKRNILDDQIKSCADVGGVIGINGISIFLGNDKDKIEQFANHIDYIVQKIGPQHVGLGLDYTVDPNEAYQFTKSYPDYFPQQTQYKEVTFIHPKEIMEIKQALINLSYSDDDITGILGGNFLRIAKDVW